MGQLPKNCEKSLVLTFYFHRLYFGDFIFILMAHYRSIFISDVHLGTRHARVEKLIEFLKENECDTLYLVGDFVDGWALKRKWFWDRHHNLLIQKLLKRVRKGRRLVYAAGNHDEFLRDYLSVEDFGGIEVVDEIVHTTAKGKRYLVIHGDKFDGVLNSFSFISKFGSWLYDVILDLNLFYNNIRKRFGNGYWSLSHFIKSNTKEAVKYCFKFEEALVFEAKRKGVDGVICGHIHNPAQKIIEGVEYHNCGCWVEMATAIVETDDGELKLLEIDR